MIFSRRFLSLSRNCSFASCLPTATALRGFWQLDCRRTFQEERTKSVCSSDRKFSSSLPWCFAAGAAAFAFFSTGSGAPGRCSSGLRLVKLGDLKDFPEGGIYEVSLDGGRNKVLVANVGGSLHCTGSSCSHYGAPLVKGVATADHVTCPWHDAKFDLKTGKCISAARVYFWLCDRVGVPPGPTLNPIPTFTVEVRGTELFAFLPENIDNEPLPTFTVAKAENALRDKTFVIVGGGPAGLAAAEELRSLGFQGKILIFSRESSPPYDRTALSKNLRCQIGDIMLRPLDFYASSLRAELRLNEDVKTIDLDKKTLTTNKASTVAFDKLLICTGSSPRRLDSLKGASSAGIFYLRNVADLEAFRSDLSSDSNSFKNLQHVIVGSSFVGMEMASALKKIGVKSVCVVGTDSVPFERVLGKRVGKVFVDLLKQNGVEYIPKVEVQEFLASDGRVNGVRISDGRVLQADRVIVGVGAVPELPSLKTARPFAASRSGGLSVDAFLRMPSHPDVFVGGDVASFPYIKSGEEVRIEHYACAMQQGRVAAANMLGGHRPYVQIPFFWSQLFGKGIRYIGHASSFDDVIVEGNLEGLEFVAYFVQGEKVVAACTMGRDPVAVAIGELMQMNLMPTATELRMGLKNSKDILESVKKAAVRKVASAPQQ